MKSTRKTGNDLPVVQFDGPQAWAVWLDEHHAQSSGVWLRIAKKASGTASVTYGEALEVALCYGWIDGQKKSYNSAPAGIARQEDAQSLHRCASEPAGRSLAPAVPALHAHV